MLNTHSKEVFDVGENIFVIYCDNVYPALITGTDIDPKDEVCPQHLDLKLGAPIYGSVTVRTHNAFHDELTARSALYARNFQLFQKYKAEIKDITDLLTFPMTHVIAGEDMDEQARMAYTDRAKELGFPLIPENKDDADLLRHALLRHALDASKII